MTLILSLLVSAALVFLFALWPVKKTAEWFHAEYATYGRSAIAIGLVLLVSLLGIGLLAQIVHPLLILVGVYVLAAFVYARVLGTSYLRGAGIAIVSYLVGVVVQVLLTLVLGSLMSGFMASRMGNLDTGGLTLSQAVDAVCACGTDADCRADRSAALVMVAMQSAGQLSKEEVQAQMKRAEYCTRHPATRPLPQDTPEEAPLAGATGAAPEEPLAAAQAAAPPATVLQPDIPLQLKEIPPMPEIQEESEAARVAPSRPPPAPAEYETIDLADVGKHLGQPAKVIEKDTAKVHEGILVPSEEEDAVNLQHKLYGGYFSAYPRLPKIAEIQVLDTERTRRQQAYLRHDRTTTANPPPAGP